MMRQDQIICAGKREKETMSEQRLQQASSWTWRREEKEHRMQAVMRWMSCAVLPTDKTVEALEALVVAGDLVRPELVSHGDVVRERYGLVGARGEAPMQIFRT
jgi:hypothetical protein